MNILFYLYQYPAIGGIEAVTAFLARSFLNRGHSVEILSHISKADEFCAVKVASGIVIHKMPDRAIYSKRNVSYLRSLVSGAQIDTIIFQDGYTPIEKNLYDANLATEVRLVVCEHNAPYAPPYYPKRSLPVWLELARRMRFIYSMWFFRHRDLQRKKRLYDNCWRYVLLSSRFYGEFRTLLGLTDTRKLRAIGNPNTSIPPSSGSKKIDEIVFVGTAEYRKGCDMLIPLFSHLAKRYPRWRFSIVGDGPLREHLALCFADYDNVTVRGYCPNATEFFSRAKIFVFPSRREGWGLVLPEAMSQGCVPICFDSYAAIRDILTEEFDSLLIPAFDLARMESCLMRLMENPNELEQLSLRAKAAVSKFDIEKITDLWMSVLCDN